MTQHDTAASSETSRIDLGYMAWKELRHFVTQTALSLAHHGITSHTLFRFKCGTTLEAAIPVADLSRRVRQFVCDAAAFVEQLHESEVIDRGGTGPLVKGIGLERWIIGTELFHRYAGTRAGAPDRLVQWQQDILDILSFFSQVTQRRYEKEPAQLTVAYYPDGVSTSNSGVLGKNLLEEYKGFLRLCRDAHSVVVIRPGCVITDILDNIRLVPADLPSTCPVPPRLGHLQQMTLREEPTPPVVFNLNRNGSMEILAHGEVVFRKVNNIWRFVDIESALEHVRKALAGLGDHEVAVNALTLGMDLADRGEGALVFLCEEPTSEVLMSLVAPVEGLIRELPGLPYQELTVRTRFTQMVGARKLTLAGRPYCTLTPLLVTVS